MSNVPPQLDSEDAVAQSTEQGLGETVDTSTNAAPQDDADAPPPAALAGWYPGPNGAKRYWDGGQWLDIPAPPDAVGSPTPRLRAPSRALVKAIAIVVVAIALLTGGFAWKSSNDAQQAQVAAEQKAAAEKKAQEDAAAAVAAAQEAADQQERDSRENSVKEIQQSIKTMAKKHVREGIIDGPVISVTCDPVAGGSVDNLSEKTTNFQCFVANKDNKDGTFSGYYYHATMNWDTGNFTYGFGES